MATRTTTRRHIISVEVVGDANLKRLQVETDRLGGRIRSLNSVSRTASRAIASTGSAARSSAFAMQNAAFQVGDFAVQMASGTAASRALAQQLPQLLGGFGPLGAVIGAASAVLAPLAGYLLNSRDAAVSMNDQLDGLRVTMEAASDALANLSLDAEDMAKKFGQAAASVRENQIALAEVRLDQLRREYEAATVSLDEFLGAFREQNKVFSQGIAAGAAEQKLTTLARLYDITVAEAGRLNDAMQTLASAQGMDAQVAAARALLDLTRELGVDIEQLAPGFSEGAVEALELRNNVAEAEELVRQLKARVDELTGSLGNASGAAATLAVNFAAAMAGHAQGAAGAFGSPAQGQIDAVRKSIDEYLDGLKKVTDAARNAASGGGGGGGGGTARLANDLDKFTASLDKFRTPAEKAADDFAELAANVEKFRGQLSPEQFALAQRGLTELSAKAKETANDFADLALKYEDDFANLFVDFATGASDAEESFRGLVDTIIAESIRLLASSAFRYALGALTGQLGAPAAGSNLASTFRAPANLSVPPVQLVRVPSSNVVPLSRAAGTGQGPSVRATVAPSQFDGAGGSGADSGYGVVNIYNNGSNQVTATESKDPTGNRTLEVSIDERIAASLRRGAGANVLANDYGLRRRTR